MSKTENAKIETVEYEFEAIPETPKAKKNAVPKTPNRFDGAVAALIEKNDPKLRLKVGSFPTDDLTKIKRQITEACHRAGVSPRFATEDDAETEGQTVVRFKIGAKIVKKRKGDAETVTPETDAEES